MSTCLLSHFSQYLTLTLWVIVARLLCPWGFSRQEYWSRLACPPWEDLPGLEIEFPSSYLLHCWVGSLPTVSPGKPIIKIQTIYWLLNKRQVWHALFMFFYLSHIKTLCCQFYYHSHFTSEKRAINELAQNNKSHWWLSQDVGLGSHSSCSALFPHIKGLFTCTHGLDFHLEIWSLYIIPISNP